MLPPSCAECDAFNGASWDSGICILSSDPEHHKRTGGDGRGGVQGLTQPPMRTAFVHFNSNLQKRTQKNEDVNKCVIKFTSFPALLNFKDDKNTF